MPSQGSWRPNDGSQIGEERDWQEFLGKGPFLSFRLKGDQVLIPQRPKVRAFIDDAPAALRQCSLPRLW